MARARRAQEERSTEPCPRRGIIYGKNLKKRRALFL